jgi:hypothetical protein
VSRRETGPLAAGQPGSGAVGCSNSGLRNACAMGVAPWRRNSWRRLGAAAGNSVCACVCKWLLWYRGCCSRLLRLFCCRSGSVTLLAAALLLLLPQLPLLGPLQLVFRKSSLSQGNHSVCLSAWARVQASPPHGDAVIRVLTTKCGGV